MSNRNPVGKCLWCVD